MPLKVFILARILCFPLHRVLRSEIQILIIGTCFFPVRKEVNCAIARFTEKFKMARGEHHSMYDAPALPWDSLRERETVRLRCSSLVWTPNPVRKEPKCVMVT
eukprot:929596_1